MTKWLIRWLKVYENEIALFVWTAILLFLVRGSGMLLNNYAETAFLKRFGVEYLPIVNMVNAVATFFIMGVVTGIMVRVPGARLLSYLFVFCGFTVAGARAIIPLGFDLIYPLLFMMKAQYEVLLALLFWNLANDLFNTRQSKRLFPLISAGGVLGQILSSFGTPFLAKTITMDNLLLAYLVTTLLGAGVVMRMGALFPTLLFSDKEGKKVKKKTPMIEEFKKIVPIVKESLMLKLLILLTFMPNVVIPIMNYQFNYAVNNQFASETALITFFGYFRGGLNIVSLIILLFVGRIYGRWGLPVALIFHPFNYMLVFISFLLRFDAFTAIYARMSSNIIRTTINIPTLAVVQGLFPESYRHMVRPFLRGTVVRIGLFLGSGMILMSEKLFHPRFLSLVALPFVIVWLITPFILKRNYAKILLGLISGNMLDLKSMEQGDLGQLFKDKKVRQHLVDSFSAARGKDRLWYAQLMKNMGMENLDALLLVNLAREGDSVTQQDEAARIGLLNMLTPEAAGQALPVFEKLAKSTSPALKVALVRAANRLSPEIYSDFNQRIFDSDDDPEVRAHAVTGLFRRSPEKYGPIIDTWLGTGDLSQRKAGVIAAAASGDPGYVYPLREMVSGEHNDPLMPEVLRGLRRLDAPALNDLVSPYLTHPREAVRSAALEALKIKDDASLRQCIALMGDTSDTIHQQARDKIEAAEFQNNLLLVESLSLPQRRIREGIFDLVAALGIKDLDVYQFARSQVEKGYGNLALAQSLELVPEGQARDLLNNHFDAERRRLLENVLRVLATQDQSGQMRMLIRGVFSVDSRQKANSLEALDDQMDIALSKILVPLLSDSPASQRLGEGRKHFSLPDFSDDQTAFLSHLLHMKDWVTVVLALFLIKEEETAISDPKTVAGFTQSANSHICEMGYCTLKRLEATCIEEGVEANLEEGLQEAGVETEITIADKILHLKKIDIFEGLAVSELAAVASIAEDSDCFTNELIIKEGETGETMYLIVEGEVSVLKGYGSEREIELDRIGSGDYFGEMALFEDEKRSATIRTEGPSRFLVLHKRDIKEIVREYPQIALHVSKVLSSRLRKLHAKVADCLV